jgi:DNA-binding NarL/FixJ family response regulator
MGPVIQRGAAGFLFLSIGGAELADDLEQVSEGIIVVDSTLAGGHPSLVASRLGDGEMNPLPWPGSHLGLTETESQVLELLALGERTASIASRLEIDPLEVKRHLRSAYRRLDVRDRSRALARLAREGLFS